ncbi:YSIRK family gram-positive signal peptide [Madurella fahalii]|uniref:YSIRK family gram-positive signal peptide n=1 Tax=Madurella fahalii TaxID=1157608 RepID=A0ABQ0FXH7_9PEZI
MAPLAREPRQVLTVLNLARRKALYTLLVEITAWMRSQLEFRESAESSDGALPLLIDPSAENSIVVPPPSAAPESAVASPALVRLRAAAIEHFDAWRKDVLAKLKEVLAAPDDATIVEERRKRTERMAAKQRSAATASAGAGGLGNSLIDDSWGRPDDNIPSAEAERAKAVARLQAYWHAIPTRLVTIPYEDRTETLSCVLLVLLSTGHYSADSRALAVYLASALELPLEVLNTEEIEIAKSLVKSSTEAATQQMSAEAEAEKRKQQNQSSRYWKVGLASVAGAAIIGVTGGLAAPVVAGAIGGIMGSVGLGGVASFLGIFWMNGALVGTLFGAFGARMTHGQGEMVDQYAREVEDFRFIPLKDEWATRGENQQDRRLRVTIGINGWLASKEDVTRPWRCLGDDSEAFALQYEMKSLMGLGKSLKELITSYAWNTVKVELLKRTVLATLWSALWPAYLLSMASTIDNPFSLAKNRSEKAGEILADALINRVQGERPVTLVGYSLGARVIYSCLRSLAQRRAFGLIDTVVFIGAPVPSNKQHWQMMRTVVSGKMFNVYSENDYLLAFLYRATSIQLGVAGLQEIKSIEGVENINLSDEVQGHMRYAKIIGNILARCELPVVKGADAPIDKDEDAIKLDDLDKDNAEMGTLIDFDGLSIAEQPPPVYSLTPSPAQPPRAQPAMQRTTVARGLPSALPVTQDPLGVGLSRVPSMPTPNTSVPKPATSASQPPSSKIGRQSSFPVSMFREDSTAQSAVPGKTNEIRPAYDATKRAAPPMSTPLVSTSLASTPPVSTSSHDVRVDDYDDDGDDSEDEGGIKMVDNDDLDYVDPTPIED